MPCLSFSLICSEMFREKGSARSSNDMKLVSLFASSRRDLPRANLYDATLRPKRMIERHIDSVLGIDSRKVGIKTPQNDRANHSIIYRKGQINYWVVYFIKQSENPLKTNYQTF